MNRKKLFIVVCTVFLPLLMSGCTTNDTNNGSDDQNWLTNYSPVHSFGAGSGDFWITYPPGNPSSGEIVTHLPWVIEALDNSCVLFVVHRTGCPYCKPQADRVIALAEKYKDQLVFFDLDIPLGGEIEQKANEAYLYDPDGPPGYIALTFVATLIEYNGTIEYCWHSWELDVDDTEMEEWVQDALYYYSVNSEG